MRCKFARVLINVKLRSYFLNKALVNSIQGPSYWYIPFVGIKLLLMLSFAVLTTVFLIQKGLENSVFSLGKIKSFNASRATLAIKTILS